tara:strand:- start:1856 stop:2794 length:939 start_codon:yes stop_codon:yes gene_type:complete
VNNEDLPPLLLSAPYRSKILYTLLLIGFFWLLKEGAAYLINNKFKDKKSHYHLLRVTDYFFWFLKIIFVGSLWFHGLGPLSTFFGLATAGIAVTFRDPLLNLMGWFTILWKHPFSVGDRIEVMGIKGDVIDINIFEFTVMEIGEWVGADQRTGRVSYIPNSTIFREAQKNFDRPYPYIWDEVKVTLTFKSNWKKAKELFFSALLGCTDSFSKEEIESFEKSNHDFYFSIEDPRPSVFASLDDKGVVLILRYVTDPRKRRKVHDALIEKVLIIIEEEEDLHFAFPSQNFIVSETPPFDFKKKPTDPLHSKNLS